ncbi:hypothetical protein HY449_03445 [Candidatus Pacearchaeota archaeon]|nr:hypothetical protein [Candidatus Pacearchaeota archaeon]
MKTEEYNKTLDELISSTEKIISKGAWINDTDDLDKFREIVVKMKQLIRDIFSNSNERIKDYQESIKIAVRRNPKDSYLEEGKVVKRYLISIKGSLKLIGYTEIKENKLDKLKQKVEEKEIEAERREKVAETKFYGAAIEIIDRLRDELKNNNKIGQDILQIKNELSEIKRVMLDIEEKFKK